MLQFIFNGIASGSIFGLVALGFSLIYRTTGFFHFSHAAALTLGAYVFYLTAKVFSAPFGIAVLVSVVACAGLGAFFELGVYRTLRTKNATNLVQIIASIGIYMIFHNVISLAAGDDTLSLHSGMIRVGFPILGTRLTTMQLSAIVVNAVFYLSVTGLLSLTHFGKKFRCVASNPDLSIMVGIRKENVILWTFICGSVLAGIGGMLFALDMDMNPSMGFHLLMMALVAGIVGGMRTTHGPVLGGLLIGILQNLSVIRISSQWQDAIVFIILIFFLIIGQRSLISKYVTGLSS